MKWLQKIFKHSLFTSLCAAALTTQSFIFFKLPIHYNYIAFVFFATVAAYNSYWLTSIIPANKEQQLINLLLTKKIEIALIALSSSLAFYFLIQSGANLLYTLFAIALYAGYSCFLFLRKPERLFALFVFYFLKTGLLSACWVLLCSVMALQENAIGLELSIIYHCYIFFFVLLLCLIFDKRDVSIDEIENLHLKTINTKLKALMQVGEITCFLVIAMAAITFTYIGVFNVLFAGLFFIPLLVYLFWLTIKSKTKQGYYFYYFWVDGSMLFSCLLLIVLNRFWLFIQA
jgi:hypothetical protein